ncbi:hypothetical protein PVAG01_04545 [Phlyctema vagabunda]|uniref:Uncharacterized protein n=1 Tax=Phlyctema vagabunda TaxID=108571 RepID=A0ABR4PHS8_9HELO
MALRLRSTIGLVILLLLVYFVLTHKEVNFGNPLPPIDLAAHQQQTEGKWHHEITAPVLSVLPSSSPAQYDTLPNPTVIGSTVLDSTKPQTTSESLFSDRLRITAPGSSAPTHTQQSSFAPKETEVWDTDTSKPLREQFHDEYVKLGQDSEAGQVYGNTLRNLVNTGTHAGFKAAALTNASKEFSFTDRDAFAYNPYPDFEGSNYKAHNQGEYVSCSIPEGADSDVITFSGQPRIFSYPPLGASYVLDVDNNLCFERETRLGLYGYTEEGKTGSSRDWNAVDWGALQETCAHKNSGRFNVPIATLTTLHNPGEVISHRSDSLEQQEKQNYVLRRSEEEKPNVNVGRDTENKHYIAPAPLGKRENDTLHGMPTQFHELQAHTRTAVLLRASSARVWTENDKQNVRSIITELSLRSGGEYQVFLLFQILDNSAPIFSDPSAYSATLHDHVPQEFWSMTVLYNERLFQDVYPKIQLDHQNSNDSHWFPVQKFALDYPGFEYYWNWDLDTRYTGHHYTFLEKLATFADMQPRKGLWERNERFYIPKYHGSYESQFRFSVESKDAANSTIWGAPHISSVQALGPIPPVDDATDDDYKWGLHEHADFISLAPIFNPGGTDWRFRDDVWGFDGPASTPRRATAISQARCSRKLLEAMHAANVDGNHIGREMAPSTLALLHGLKAVYAPHPVYLDREWEGRSLNRWFNPIDYMEAGSTVESPFGDTEDQRFRGSTWSAKGEVARKLYNHWLGWEDGGVGGVEWERTNGRVCLPPMLLYPIRDLSKTIAGSSSLATKSKESDRG